jgi:hypothetical protein
MDRLTLTLDIRANEVGNKDVNVRSSLVVANLLAEIQDKFNLDGMLELRPEDGDGPLELGKPLDQIGIEDGAKLICERVVADTGTRDAIRQGVRIPFEEGKFKRVYFEEEHTLTEYDVGWQPAIIGRWDHRDPSKNRLLAIDLESIEDLPTVSRHHACLTVDGGEFFVEQLAARNPTYLDGKKLEAGRKYPLSAGSRIQVGSVSLTFYVVS